MSQTGELEKNGARDAADDVIPANAFCVGEIGADDVRVYLHQDVYNALESYSREGNARDRGAILLGQYREDSGKLHVLISGCVEAKYADTTGGVLRFTQETWDYVQRVRTLKHPDKWIVGWEHSQPGRGLILSDHDRQLHADYFELPFQLVYLIDPEQKQRGFYQWQGGSLSELNGFYVYDEPGKTIKLRQAAERANRSAAVAAGAGAAAAAEGAAETPQNGSARSMLSVAVILALLIAVAALAISLAMRKNVQDQNTQLAAQSSRQAEIEAQLSGTEGDGDLQATLADVMALLTEHQNTIERQQQTIEALQNELGQGGGSGTATPTTTPAPTPTPAATTTDDSPYLTYTVKAGDTLMKICNNLGVSYLDHKDEILQLNNITNENFIIVGATYRFPKP